MSCKKRGGPADCPVHSGHSRAPEAGPGGGCTAWPLQPDARLRAWLCHFPAVSLQNTRRHGAHHTGQTEASQGSERVLGKGSGWRLPGSCWDRTPTTLQMAGPAFTAAPAFLHSPLRFQAGCPPQTSNLKVPCRPCSPQGVLLPGNNGYASRSCTCAHSGRSGHGRAGRPSRAFSERHRAPPPFQRSPCPF